MTFWRRIAEFMVPNLGGLRSMFRMSGNLFPHEPIFDKTGVNYDLARQLYRNDGEDVFLGGGFCKPVIDRCVEFMGIPAVSVGDETVDNELNDAIQKSWAAVIEEMFRNAMRDSKTVVRMWQSPLTPLITEEERSHCKIETIDPERCTFIYNAQNPEILERVVITYEVAFPDTSVEISPSGDPPRGQRPQTKFHRIWEVVTQDSYRYWDESDAVWLTSWERENLYGFIPIMEVWNEYDSALSGGQSDLESVYPFVKSFHEVLLQGLQAHKYHSTPKLNLQIEDVYGFLGNNFPDTIDEDGKIIAGSTIKWRGREIIITGVNDKVGFIEAKSVLGDTKTLLEFLVDCISVASATPEEFFMRTEQGAAATGTTRFAAFEKKVERKQKAFAPYIQMLCKMHAAINNRSPQQPEVFWDENRPENLAATAQALQQIVMSLEIVLQRQLVSDDTAREMLRSTFKDIFRIMKSPSQEAADAKSNIDLTPVLPGPAGDPVKNGKGKSDNVPVPVTQKAGGGRNE
jgi:hypothetical protein